MQKESIVWRKIVAKYAKEQFQKRGSGLYALAVVHPRREIQFSHALPHAPRRRTFAPGDPSKRRDGDVDLQEENATLKATVERVGLTWALWVCEGFGVNGNPIDDLGEALDATEEQKQKWLDIMDNEA